MVEIATSLGRSGLQDWLIQRVSAVIIALYLIFLMGYFFSYSNKPFTYAEWQSLFSNPFMRFGSFLVLLSLLAHAWIGFWSITTDYLKNLTVRLLVQLIFILGVLLCLAWGIKILWNF